MKINIVPIGMVKNSVTEPPENDWETVVSEIVIDKEYEQALDRLEGFSHIIVLYWMSHITSARRSTLQVRPKRRKDLPLVGVFATRSPARPNPIGVTTAKVLEHHGNILKVAGLDALDGTPVLDIKPYIPGYDSPAEATTPAWMKKLT